MLFYYYSITHKKQLCEIAVYLRLQINNHNLFKNKAHILMAKNSVSMRNYLFFPFFKHINITFFIYRFLHIEIFRHPIDKAFFFHL